MTKISVSMLASDYSKFGEEALRMQRAHHILLLL